MKYRIVEIEPEVYIIKYKRFLFWKTHVYYTGEYNSLCFVHRFISTLGAEMEIEKLHKKHVAESFKSRVVKEIEK